MTPIFVHRGLGMDESLENWKIEVEKINSASFFSNIDMPLVKRYSKSTCCGSRQSS